MGRSILALLLVFGAPSVALAAGGGGPEVAGVPVDFVLFFATLLGVALFHKHTLAVALTGLAVVTAYKLGFSDFHGVPGMAGFGKHLAHEWGVLANLFLLLIGFAILASHFEESHVPDALPKFLPDDWKGAFFLLVLVFILSGFLDNIAAAIIGGSVAHTVFKGKVHLGYLAAIVACANAGGAGSVVGDTTTTMMWIDGISPLTVAPAYLGAAAALLVCGLIAARQQDKHQPILKDPMSVKPIDWARVGIVGLILAAVVGTNVTINLLIPDIAEAYPFLGGAVWVAILATAPLRKPEWHLLPEAAKGSLFLISLVLTASVMPVDKLPAPTWVSALVIGFVSSIFDNIPLTKLALQQGGQQGGYDWAFMAYAVGYGGSLIWFGSSAGVALSNKFPEARSVFGWLKAGWHVAVAYVVGFFVMLAVLGWHPDPAHKVRTPATPATPAPAAPAAPATPAPVATPVDTQAPPR